MAAQTHSATSVRRSPLALSAATVAVAGAGLVVYGAMFLVRNFNGFLELGITSDLIGTTAEALQRGNPLLYHYISHLQVALAGFIIALGLAVIGLGWFGIRQGSRWALLTAFVAPVVAVGIALPLHYPYGFDTIGHLGLIYLDAAILLVGTVLANRALNQRQ
ncbi:MAG: hypothetical protein IPO81_19420 [Kouleothrix sp.]|nr:hypothetical protein [Kouleothrix sp.]